MLTRNATEYVRLPLGSRSPATGDGALGVTSTETAGVADEPTLVDASAARATRIARIGRNESIDACRSKELRLVGAFPGSSSLLRRGQALSETRRLLRFS